MISRRALLGMGAVMGNPFTPGGDPGTRRSVAAGLPPARLDQLYRPPQQQMAPGAAAGTFKGRQVVVFGTGPGVGIFVYNGAPGPGTLVESITQASADPYGNHTIPGGDAVYNNAAGSAVLFAASGMQGYHGSLAGGWSTFSASRVLFDNAGNVDVNAQSTLVLSGGAGVLHPTQMQLLANSGVSLNSGPLQIVPPSGDATGATDTAAINNALTTSPVVLLDALLYNVNAPIVVPTGVQLRSFTSWQANPIASFALPLQGAILQPVAGFTGAAVINLTASGTGNGGQEIDGISIDGSLLPAGSVHGLALTGPVCAASFRNMAIQKVTGDGIHLAGSGGNPDQLLFENIGIHQAGAHGVNQTTGVSDSLWSNLWVSASGSDNWAIVNGGESYWFRCRGENAAAGWGFNFTAVIGFPGTVTFIDCETAGNPSGGFLVQGAGAGVFNLQWCHAGEATKWSYTNTGGMVVNSPAAFNTSTAAPTFA